jgi:hypothetical protein
LLGAQKKCLKNRKMPLKIFEGNKKSVVSNVVGTNYLRHYSKLPLKINFLRHY